MYRKFSWLKNSNPAGVFFHTLRNEHLKCVRTSHTSTKASQHIFPGIFIFIFSFNDASSRAFRGLGVRLLGVHSTCVFPVVCYVNMEIIVCLDIHKCKWN